jgi:hypothetical protein
MHVRIESYKEAFSDWFSIEDSIGVDFVHVARRPVIGSAVCNMKGVPLAIPASVLNWSGTQTTVCQELRFEATLNEAQSFL